MICYNYWCVTEKQKEQYLKRLSQNEQQYQKILNEKYNPDNIFENKKLDFIENTTTPTEITEYKESIFKKLINKIKSIFSKK